MFVPPLNLGGFQPSPATLAQWVYQIWQYLQENPIATEEQLKEYIGTFITTSPETQAMIGEGVEQYLTENPPTAPVQSVQGKTGAVQLAYNEIVPSSNAVPVYKAASTPSANTLTGQYNLGYRLFVNTATQEIFTISPAGALSLVGRGKIDGTTIDLNSAEGDTTINEAIEGLDASLTSINRRIDALYRPVTVELSGTTTASGAFDVGVELSNYAWVDMYYLGDLQGLIFRRDKRYLHCCSTDLTPKSNTAVTISLTYLAPVA